MGDIGKFPSDRAGCIHAPGLGPVGGDAIDASVGAEAPADTGAVVDDGLVVETASATDLG